MEIENIQDILEYHSSEITSELLDYFKTEGDYSDFVINEINKNLKLVGDNKFKKDCINKKCYITKNDETFLPDYDDLIDKLLDNLLLNEKDIKKKFSQKKVFNMIKKEIDKKIKSIKKNVDFDVVRFGENEDRIGIPFRNIDLDIDVLETDLFNEDDIYDIFSDIDNKSYENEEIINMFIKYYKENINNLKEYIFIVDKSTEDFEDFNEWYNNVMNDFKDVEYWFEELVN